MARPTSKPELAKEDDANIAEPITALKENGWDDNAIPTAKNWNWFSHWVNKWINWFEEQIDLLISPTVVTINVTATGFSGTAPTGTISYQRFGDFLAVHITTITGTSNATDFTLTVTGGGSFSSEFNPVGPQNRANVIVGNASAPAVGSILFNSGLSYLVVECGKISSTQNHDIGSTYWESSGTKGIENCCFWLYRPLP